MFVYISVYTYILSVYMCRHTCMCTLAKQFHQNRKKRVKKVTEIETSSNGN